MPWRGPSYEGEFPTIGFDVLDWAEAEFKVPDGPLAGEPLALTDEQAKLILRFYGLDDRGRFLFRRAAVRRSQGWGKSPLLAIIALAELVGPTRFDGWNADGEPVAKPPTTPWVQVAAVSEDQTDNTYAALYTMASESALAGTTLDVGLTRIFLKGDIGRLEPVSAAAGTRLGQRVTFAVLDETHLWIPRSGGRKLANTIRRNAGKMGGRTFESTNAHSPGEESVAESTYEAAQKGAAGLLYDALEAPPVADLTDREAVLEALRIAYGDSRWVDLERLADEIADPATDPSDARRFYFSQLVASNEAGIDPLRWAAAARPGPRPDAGARIGIGFDGSIANDSTALIGCTEDRRLFTIKVWTRPPNVKEWRVPRSEVHEAVRDAFGIWSVGRMLCDPPKWETEVESWQQTYGDEVVLAFDTFSTRRMAPACDRFATDLATDLLTHSDDPVVTAHVTAMARKKVRLADDPADGRTRFVFTKADTRKIDAGIAAVLANEAAATMPAEELLDVAANVW